MLKYKQGDHGQSPSGKINVEFKRIKLLGYLQMRQLNSQDTTYTVHDSQH